MCKAMRWIDWHQGGNLIACGCVEKTTRIYDARANQIVQLLHHQL